jgi:hypothetical protein
VFGRPLVFGYERIGRFLNTIVEERIGALPAQDEPGAGRLPEGSVDLLF